MRNWIVTSDSLYFGVNKSNKITVGSLYSTGIIVEKTTWIKKEYNKNNLEKDLKLPIKIKLSWEGNTEYVIISNIDVTFK